MSRPMGFSTGALSKANYCQAMSWIDQTSSDALELSALREEELPGLLGAIVNLDVTRYRYKSIHAPKSFHRLSEAEAVRMLLPFANQGFRIILHPDAIQNFDAWRQLGRWLCIENMDTRKATGRTAQELRGVFEKLPDARFCFDIGHARQVDPSMAVAFGLLFEFRDRLEEIHASEVDTSGHHWAMSRSCLDAFGAIASRIAVDVAVIIESQVPQSRVAHELKQTRDLFGRHT